MHGGTYRRCCCNKHRQCHRSVTAPMPPHVRMQCDVGQWGPSPGCDASNQVGVECEAQPRESGCMCTKRLQCNLLAGRPAS